MYCASSHLCLLSPSGLIHHELLVRLQVLLSFPYCWHRHKVWIVAHDIVRRLVGSLELLAADVQSYDFESSMVLLLALKLAPSYHAIGVIEEKMPFILRNMSESLGPGLFPAVHFTALTRQHSLKQLAAYMNEEPEV